jgi:hypothetical protein
MRRNRKVIMFNGATGQTIESVKKARLEGGGI